MMAPKRMAEAEQQLVAAKRPRTELGPASDDAEAGNKEVAVTREVIAFLQQ